MNELEKLGTGLFSQVVNAIKGNNTVNLMEIVDTKSNGLEIPSALNQLPALNSSILVSDVLV